LGKRKENKKYRNNSGPPRDLRPKTEANVLKFSPFSGKIARNWLWLLFT